MGFSLDARGRLLRDGTGILSGVENDDVGSPSGTSCRGCGCSSVVVRTDGDLGAFDSALKGPSILDGCIGVI